VIDIAPTIYNLLDIPSPREVNGVPQDPIDGVSMVYTFDDAKAKGQRTTQFFDIMGSRGIFHADESGEWFASAFGPRTPWIPGMPKGIHEWSPEKDVWELYDLSKDWSQANNLADKMPEKLASMKDLFLVESTKNNNLPIGGGLWTPVLHPEDGPSTPYSEWTFSGNVNRMPEFAAPKLGKTHNTVTIDAEIPEKANGVLYALGGFSGGLSCYMLDGKLCYEYNLFEINRTHIKSEKAISTGKVKIVVETKPAAPRPGSPLAVTMKVNDKVVASGEVPMSAPLAFTANDCFDIGSDLGSPVSIDYFDNAPFKFSGNVEQVKVNYVK